MTHETLLARMELLDRELETASGEDDETLALAALDLAQDHFESLAASYPHVFRTSGTVLTVANVETSAKPQTILRLDSLWYLDTTVTPNLPRYQLEPVSMSGGHVPSLPWPIRASLGMSPGAPDGYFDDDESFFWSPVPDAVYTLRWYGMKSQSDITTRGGTFAYKDHIATAFATFAVRAMKVGLEDGSDALKLLADEVFTTVIQRAKSTNREGPEGRVYSQLHTT